MSLFDYVPSISIFSPIENSTDNFRETVKVASFELPPNSTLDELTDYLYELCDSYYYDNPLDYYADPTGSKHIRYNCQANVLGYSRCEISYTFDIKNNIESIQYGSWQFFTRKNGRVYLISLNTESYSNLTYPESVEEILKSFRIL